MSAFVSTLLCLAIWIGVYVNCAAGFWHPAVAIAAMIGAPIIARIHYLASEH